MTGRDIKQAMIAARVTAKELATEASYSREYVTRLLNSDGDLPFPTVGRLLTALSTCARRVVAGARATV